MSVSGEGENILKNILDHTRRTWNEAFTKRSTWQLKPPANTDAHGGLSSRVDAHAAASSSRLMLRTAGRVRESETA